MSIVMVTLIAILVAICGIGAALAVGLVDCGPLLFVIHALERATGAAPGAVRRRCAASVFSGRIVWITGASQGVGRDLALAIAVRADPDALILTARNESQLEEVRDDILKAREERLLGAATSSSPLRVIVLPADLLASHASLSEALTEQLRSIPGGDIRGVEACVCCVGTSQRASVEETEHAVDARMMDLCCGTATKVIKLEPVLGRMLERGHGTIALINSMAGVVPSPGQASYAMAKHALRGWTETLRSEVSGRGVDVTTLCPGPVKVERGPSATSATRVRTVMGPRLRATVDVPESGGGKVSSDRAVSLMVTAIDWKLSEVWIAQKPLLLVAYIYNVRSSHFNFQIECVSSLSIHVTDVGECIASIADSCLRHFLDACIHAPSLPHGVRALHTYTHMCV